MILETGADALLDSFMTRLRAVDKAFDYGFKATPGQRKEILNVCPDRFILYKDGKIDLRLKVSVNDKQVAEEIQELSCVVLLLMYRTSPITCHLYTAVLE